MDIKDVSRQEVYLWAAPVRTFDACFSAFFSYSFFLARFARIRPTQVSALIRMVSSRAFSVTAA